MRVLIFFSLLVSFSYSQFRDGFFNIGKSWGVTKITGFSYNITALDSPSAQFGNLKEAYVSNRILPVNFEVYGGNAYFEFGVGLRPKKWLKRHPKNSNLLLTDGPTFTMRLALGGYLNENFALMFGGQIGNNRFNCVNCDDPAFDTYVKTSDNVPVQLGNYLLTTSAGYMYGLNANTIIYIAERIAIRNTFMFDWISQKGIPGNKEFKSMLWKGNSMTLETAIFFKLTKGDPMRNFAIQLRGALSKRTVSQTYLPDSPGITFVPKHNLYSYNISVMISLPLIIFSAFTAEAYD